MPSEPKITSISSVISLEDPKFDDYRIKKLTKRQLLCLRDHEGNETSPKEGDYAEEDVRPVSDVLEHIGRDLTDDEVVHPVWREKKVCVRVEI